MAKLEKFSDIFDRASERKGGSKALAHLLPLTLEADEIGQFSDAQLLSAMSKQVFQSGFVWRVVENKWPAYEKAFFDFEPFKVLMLSPDQIQQRATDATLIRHQKKTQSIVDNAYMVQQIAAEHGSFAEFIANWPSEDITGLWQVLKKKGSRLGGNTGPYFLRNVGKDTFLLTTDVQSYLKATKVVDAGFTSQTALRQSQAAFNHWQQESGLTLAEISRIISLSVGENRL
ncbi:MULTISPECIES: DNA-3-methyladenine glycosylase I [unclassified Shewanella]|uniref:DNA-3-methyladenine glycosylase I n=1 Tax=unclassified Shewanella TaxID=196818 RepID=UPI000C828514|nr:MULTISPECIES: DNA-3-methyladenine glycosylase I [unclassified Shewanella]MDO6619948.1 DNA-3-methyladenine glycosylase I [Shewanella sp. 6_MG-2023]MDO6639570.1 DNA-3-methyladenine glycosylase I [Shewanella sp. 5_MG-2023]PMH86152.1 3-methyladenine DNA glycosylase [Shewanella sp. 10N.286.48.B5]PMH98996.1 3-methyladenine DNA glycosylase [Shewanella sp. 10N.286.48.A6]